MAKASIHFAAAITAFAAASCASPCGSHYWCSAGGISVKQIEQALCDNPIGADQDILVTTLGTSAEVSHHLVQVRDAEPLHIHRNHDLTVFVYRGHGTMRVGEHRFEVKGGDILFVARGMPHAFQNRSMTPAVAIVAFTPAFDGKDTEAVGQ